MAAAAAYVCVFAIFWGLSDSRSSYKLDQSWPSEEAKKVLGQVSGVDIDVMGNPVIFHRGDRVWDRFSFNGRNQFTGSNFPIRNKTVVTLDKNTGDVLHSWGDSMFYLPHMLTVDKQNNVWVTDVGLHQVFKFSAPTYDRPVLTLGTKLEPGNDDSHFCKPTSVAVTRKGDVFFVADGYCNGRVIKYRLNPDGSGAGKLLEWGRLKYGAARRPDDFFIAHSLTLNEDAGEIYVADREHRRIQCFKMSDARFVRSIRLENPVYGLSFVPRNNAKGGRLVAVTGAGKNPPEGIIFDEEGNVIDKFSADEDGLGFERPHDVAADARQVYEVELSAPFRVYKFYRD